MESFIRFLHLFSVFFFFCILLNSVSFSFFECPTCSPLYFRSVILNMNDSAVCHRPSFSSASSGDVSICFAPSESGNAALSSSGKTGVNCSRQNASGGSSKPGEADPSPSHGTNSGKLKPHRGLSQLIALMFDEKVSPRKKMKHLKPITNLKHDGAVHLDLPEDMKPLSIDFGDGVHYNGSADHDPLSADIEDIRPLQILILIVGTRGDVQPFVAIGKRLQEHGHRVRLATHANFKDFVIAGGLEFFPLGGDPKVLAGYMVKNKGFLPADPTEVHIQRNQMKDIINSLLPACQEDDLDSKVPFRAEAIIANPPVYGHTHLAEALDLPLHIFFTIPWTPTSEFPHPLSRVTQPVAHKLSYQIVDTLIWLGIRDIINDFRKKQLKLRRITYLSGNNIPPFEVPHAYIWSPHLVPKPKDWGPKIDVVGFCFLDLASQYEPPDALVKWLEAGEKPIYVGFGSLPVLEPKKMTQIIVQALEITGQRGIINKGWGGLGDLEKPKESVYVLDNCPHDWLFPRCIAVVHHGGAGTTAAGLKAGCPTTIVPFFGDQPFWGERVHARGVGPMPIAVDDFSLDKLVNAIQFMLEPEVKECAMKLAKAMEKEDGVTGAVRAFYKHFPRKDRDKDDSDDEPLPSPSSARSVSRCFGCS